MITIEAVISESNCPCCGNPIFIDKKLVLDNEHFPEHLRALAKAVHCEFLWEKSTNYFENSDIGDIERYKRSVSQLLANRSYCLTLPGITNIEIGTLGTTLHTIIDFLEEASKIIDVTIHND